MPYSVSNGIWRSVFAVPTEIADRHLKLCGALSLKVLLLVLRHGEMDDNALAEALGHSPADIRDAAYYWVHAGVLSPDTDPAAETPVTLRYEQLSAAEPPPAEQRQDADSQKITRLGKARQRMTTQDINELAERDDTIRMLLQETQAILGKELTPLSTDTVVSLYAYYGMQPDLILMLIQYCVFQDRCSMRQIEKEAAAWLEQGIDTHEKAEAEILRRMESRKMEQRIQQAFGIRDRRLGAKERGFVDTWVHQYKMELPLIELAFERTIEIKGQLSFDYINGILTNWHKKGITTPAKAMQEISSKQSPAPQPAGKKAKASYDMDALQDMITYNNILE